MRQKKKPSSEQHEKFLKGIRKKKTLVTCLRVLLLVFLLGLWELCAFFNLIDTYITSSPSRIFATIGELIREWDLFTHAGITLVETLEGFFLSMLIGTGAAILLWSFDTLWKVLEPYIVVLNSLPKIALGPVIIIWCGTGTKSIVVMAILICVIITLLNMLTAFRSCEEEKILLLRSMGANKFQILVKLVLPASLPSFISVLKINVGMAWVGTIMGEYLVSRAGLGYLISYGGTVLNLDMVMASTVVLCFLAAAMYACVALLEKLVRRRD